MKMTLRWFGKDFDSVTLQQIRQIPGVTGVITTLYDIPAGDVWPIERIKAMQAEVEAEGLKVEGIESVNIHDSIKIGSPDREQYIDYLNKEPGVYSARYMGENTDYHIKNANLIQRLDGVPDEQRTARFVCAIAAAFPDGRVETVRGTMEGRIGYEESGENGFGYDPIFFLPEYGCTSAELSMEEKNKISHRGKALQAIKEELR